eukprot:COSAG06_NODE_4310_length_4372_cov_6.521179_3_plen_78_part_00
MQDVAWRQATSLAFNPDAPYELFLDHPTAGRYTIDLHQQDAYPPPSSDEEEFLAEQESLEQEEARIALSAFLSTLLR